jgi:hypothetical protein
MGAVADIVNMGDWSRMRMWLLAIGIAILGSAALHASGQIDLGKSIYRTPTFTWLSYWSAARLSASAWYSPPVAARKP